MFLFSLPCLYLHRDSKMRHYSYFLSTKKIACSAKNETRDNSCLTYGGQGPVHMHAWLIPVLYSDERKIEVESRKLCVAWEWWYSSLKFRTLHAGEIHLEWKAEISNAERGMSVEDYLYINSMSHLTFRRAIAERRSEADLWLSRQVCAQEVDGRGWECKYSHEQINW